MKKIIGYTAGVFDLFHIGHINMLRNAKKLCDVLIIAVSTDEWVKKYKNKVPMIPFEQRVEVVKACRYSDIVISQHDDDRIKIWKKLKFNIMFVGDDWYDDLKWRNMEEEFKKLNVRIIYFPYTQSTSSTKINKLLREKRKWGK